MDQANAELCATLLGPKICERLLCHGQLTTAFAAWCACYTAEYTGCVHNFPVIHVLSVVVDGQHPGQVFAVDQGVERQGASSAAPSTCTLLASGLHDHVLTPGPDLRQAYFHQLSYLQHLSPSPMPTPQKKNRRKNTQQMTTTNALGLTKISSSVEQIEQRMDELAVGGSPAFPCSGLLILLRGLPGVGKTKTARQLASRYPNSSVVISPDDHLGPWRHSRVLSRTDLSDALAACKQAAWSAMRSKTLFIIVDKENLKYADMLPYVSEASRTGYEVHFLEPPKDWRYSCEVLAKKNRRGLTQLELSQMLDNFERYWSAEDMLANVVSRQTLCSGPSKPIIDTCPPLVTPVLNTETLDVENTSCCGPVDPESTPDIVEKLMASTRLLEENSAGSVDRSDDNVNPSVFEQLCELFPESDRATLREIADATNGDLEWAAGLALEADKSSAGKRLLSADRTEELYQAAAQLSAPAVFPETTAGRGTSHETDSFPLERPALRKLSDQDSYTKLDTALADLTEFEKEEATDTDNEDEEAEEDSGDDRDTATEKAVEGPSVSGSTADSPTLRITREFVRHAFQRYAAEIDMLKVDLDLDSLPEEVFSDWTPEPELEKSILSSFLRQLGYFEMLNSNRKNNFRVTRSRFPASNSKRPRAPPTWKRSRQVSNDVKCGNQGGLLPVDSNLCSLEDVLLEETAVRLSIEEQKKHFEIPLNQNALNSLSQQFPGIDREILMETLVRCGFDLETSIACIVAGVLDKDSFAEASRMSAFEANVAPSTALKTPSPNDGDSLDKDVDLSFQEILDEEEAISRSVADQSKNMQTLAVQLTLKRLASQFPGFEKPYLINLFIKSGMNEDATRQHLAEHGRAAEPLPPFTPLVPMGSPAATRPPASVTVSSLPLAKESLATLEEEIDGIRRSIKDLHDVRLGAKANSVHPGVVAFYNEELRTLRCRLNHREDLHRDLLVAIRSQEHALAAVGRERADSKSSTRAGLAFLDLHGLKLHHAMIALRRRLALLESGCPTTPTAAAIAIAPCPNFWLPKRLTVNLQVTCRVLVNDTVGALASCAFLDPNTAIGLIVGTGTNAAYVEKLSNAKKITGFPPEIESVVINTEWGAFGEHGCINEFLTEFDKQIDKDSLNPGKQVFEKLISGMYLGEIARLILLKLAEEGHLFDGIVPPLLREKNGIPANILSEVERFHPTFAHTMIEVLTKLVPSRCTFRLKLSEDGSGKGAGALVAAAKRALQAE
ncbi:hypothetical protein SprV_0200733000 [Sparganum proliferum]